MHKGFIAILFVLLSITVVLIAVQGKVFGQSMLNLPFTLTPSPETYGSVAMGKASLQANVKPVTFSHWMHRVKYTCRVCHYELEFSMKSNETPIVCDNGRMGGRYCAACHNGKISFGPADGDEKNCARCHGADSSDNWVKFEKLQEKLPQSKFGNEINWTKALEEGSITPLDSLSGSKRKIVNISTLKLEAELAGISYAVFPHQTHEKWLDCSNCHPELFNIKKKTTETLRMSSMVRGESCGLCHLRVAFPLNDCTRCHPAMKMF